MTNETAIQTLADRLFDITHANATTLLKIIEDHLFSADAYWSDGEDKVSLLVGQTRMQQ